MRLFYLYRRKESPLWYVLFMDAQTGQHLKRRSTKTSDKRQAEAIAQDWLANGLPDEDAGDKPQRKMSFCDYLTAFWDFDQSGYFRELETMGKEPCRRHARETRKLVGRYFEPYFRTLKLGQLNEVKFQKFLVFLKTEKNLSASTVNHARNAAFVALRYAKRNKIIRTFDFEAVLRAGGAPRERGILEREEVDALFDVEWRDPRSRLVTLIASKTGMRIGEIRALRICDVHEDYIYVEHNWSAVDGGLKKTKNKKTRKVPIMPELHEEIIAYITKFQLGTRLDRFLFPGVYSDSKPYSLEKIERDFKDALSKIGINEATRLERKIVFHSWRHFMAKNLANVTTRNIAKKILGQETDSVFERYADHVDKETFAKMTEAIKQGIKSDEEIKPPIPFPQASGK